MLSSIHSRFPSLLRPATSPPWPCPAALLSRLVVAPGVTVFLCQAANPPTPQASFRVYSRSSTSAEPSARKRNCKGELQHRHFHHSPRFLIIAALAVPSIILSNKTNTGLSLQVPTGRRLDCIVKRELPFPRTPCPDKTTNVRPSVSPKARRFGSEIGSIEARISAWRE